MSSKIKFAVRSEVGNIRTNNEDNLYCNGRIMTANERDKPFFFEGVTEAPAIFAVCDRQTSRNDAFTGDTYRSDVGSCNRWEQFIQDIQSRRFTRLQGRERKVAAGN